MIGLIRNNFYASIANIKWFSIAMLAFGVIAISINNDGQTLLISFLLLCMVGFPANSIASLRKESVSKWNQYKLTVPVRRKDIVKSYFISQIIWLLVGVSFAGIGAGLSILFYGYPFDRIVDLLLLFSSGISVSFFMGAIFYPLFYLGGSEKNEAILIISLLFAIGIFTLLIILLNWIFPPKQTLLQTLFCAAFLCVSGLVTFILSYFMTVGIFKQTEF